jgi:hypothetical protein
MVLFWKEIADGRAAIVTPVPTVDGAGSDSGCDGRQRDARGADRNGTAAAGHPTCACITSHCRVVHPRRLRNDNGAEIKLLAVTPVLPEARAKEGVVA